MQPHPTLNPIPITDKVMITVQEAVQVYGETRSNIYGRNQNRRAREWSAPCLTGQVTG